MSRLTELLDEAVTVAIIGHIRPDGDDIGSCLGTYNYIIENYPDKKKVRVFLESKISKFNFMHGYDDICHKMDKDDRDYDKIICAGIFSGLCGVLVQCYFENIFEEPYMMAYFWGLAAVLIYFGYHERKD